MKAATRGTSSGSDRVAATLVATPHHLVPVRLVPTLGTYLVYLMWRADRGWRIGRTVGARPIGVGQLKHGLFVRTNQEHADAAWILKVCGSVAEAAYFEAWFAAEYGLPTTCFHAAGRVLAMDDPWLERLYRSIDTDSRAKLLMEERLLHREFPHHRPQNGSAPVHDQSHDVLGLVGPPSDTTGSSGRRTGWILPSVSRPPG